MTKKPTKKKARKTGGITNFGGKAGKSTAFSDYGKSKRRTPANRFMGR
jgi:hypothetical protein